MRFGEEARPPVELTEIVGQLARTSCGNIVTRAIDAVNLCRDGGVRAWHRPCCLDRAGVIPMKMIATVLFVLLVNALVNLGCAETPAADRATTAASAAAVDLAKPEVPGPVAVSPTAKLALKLHAVGAQIYSCAAVTDDPAGSGTTYRWKLKAPEATLFDASGATVGKHYAGPKWQYKDGSVLAGAKVAEVKAPGQDDIAWLLLKAVSHEGQGVFTDVTFAQRLNTSKGKAPADGCDASAQGHEARADYSADYLFYTGGV